MAAPVVGKAKGLKLADRSVGISTRLLTELVHGQTAASAHGWKTASLILERVARGIKAFQSDSNNSPLPTGCTGRIQKDMDVHGWRRRSKRGDNAPATLQSRDGQGGKEALL